MNNEEFWIDYLNKRGLVLRNAKGEAIHQDVYDLLKEQKKRDWEEFRGMICHLRFVTSTENESEEVAKQVMDKALEYYKEKIADMIDSKIKEL